MRHENGDYPRLVYIAGTGRSGSSILDWTLGTNRSIVGLGEVHRLSISPTTRTCSCGETLDLCPFWSAVREELGHQQGRRIDSWGSHVVHVPLWDYGARQAWISRIASALASDAILRRTHRWSLVSRQYAMAVSRAAELYRVIASGQGASAVVDSTKSPVRLRAFHALYPGSVKVIHLTRDGRGVVCSLVRRTGCSVATAAGQWASASRNVRLALRRLPKESVFHLRYEDLCGRVDVVRDSLSVWLEIPDLSLRPESQDIGTQHQVPGSPILYRPRADLVEDSRWKTELTASDLRTFSRVAGREQQRLGYAGG